MPEFAPGAFFWGIVVALTVIVVRWQNDKPRLSTFRLMVVSIAGAYLIPHGLALLDMAWRSQDWLPPLPVVTSGQIFLGAFAGFAALTIGNTQLRRKRISLWAGALIGVATAALLPPIIDGLTGRYQRPSLRDDVNDCTRGMLGQARPVEVTNICAHPITVGLCMPGEVNPDACVQSHTIRPGEVALLDPADAVLAYLPGNPNGLTVVACRPPDRPSRMVAAHGRGYEGVCIPPG